MKELLKILLLEDNADDAEMIKRMILREKLNCEFSLATDKDAYLLFLDTFCPQIILADHSLPQFNSEDAFMIARQRFPDIPFIMVTGTVSEQYAVDMIKMGVDDYILKDRMARLPAAIITAIRRRKAEKEKQYAEKKIILSESNLRTIFENTSEGFLLLNKDAVIMAFNNKATFYVFFSNVKEFQIGQSIYDFIEEERQKFFHEIITRALNGENIQYDRSFKMKNGSIAWIDFSVTPVIEMGTVKGICISGRDITEKKIIEQEREFDRNNLMALINNTNDLMWSVDRDLRLITSNEAFDGMVKAMSGKTIERGSDVLSSGFGEELLNLFRKYYERAFSGESFMELVYTDFSDDLWSEISFYPIYNESIIVGAACFSHDITMRKKAEKEIADYKNALLEQKVEQQKKIARAIVKAQEKERSRLGQELHDNVNQILASTKMHLNCVAREHKKMKELIKYPIELLDSTIEEIRLLSSRLVTPLKNINLKELIQALLDDLSENTTIKTTFVSNLSNQLISEDLKLNIYRIIQEQLNNIVKHAGATNIRVSMQREDSTISIIVRDDGKGFDVNEKREGIGISNIINRVESFNGEVMIESSSGKGTALFVSLGQ